MNRLRYGKIEIQAELITIQANLLKQGLTNKITSRLTKTRANRLKQSR